MPNFSPAQPSLPPRLGRALLVGSIGAVLATVLLVTAGYTVGASRSAPIKPR